MAIAAIFFLWNLFEGKKTFVNGDNIKTQLMHNPLQLGLIFILMPANWLIETYKWNLVIKRFQLLSFSQAFQSILVGVLLSILSPNRIGELGGRLVFIKKNSLLAAFYGNILSAISQLLITLLTGLLAVFFLNETLAAYVNLSAIWIKALSVGIIVISLFIYFSSDFLRKALIFFIKKLKISSMEINQVYGRKIRVQLLLLSLFRYFVFSFQFGLALWVFEVEMEYSQALAGISMVFLAAAVVPTTWISNLPVRGSIAYLIFETLFNFGMEALFSSFFLWIINLLIPACLGLFVLPKVNWIRLKNLRL